MTQSSTFIIFTTQDSTDEPDEVVTLTFTDDPDNPRPSGVAQINVSSTITILDDDPTVVSLAKVSSATSINEGGKVEFTVTLGRALIAGETIDVPLSISGTGVTTGDWSLAKKSGGSLNTGVTLQDTGTAMPKVRFSGAAAQTATLELTATADGTSEGSETINVALGPDGAGANGFDHTSLGTNVGGGADPHGANNDFDIMITPDTTPPRITSITRHTPSSSPTNADVLRWRVTFNEAVQNVDAADFQVSGATATLLVAQVGATNAYNVTATAGNLANLDGTVTLSFANGQNIEDSSGNDLTNTTPTGTNDNTFEMDNTAPRVSSIERQTPSSSPTNADSLKWRVTFSEAVQNVNAADFQVSGATNPAVGAVRVGDAIYDVTAIGGNLASLDATVTLSFTSVQNIEDSSLNRLTNTTPTGTNHNTFEVDNTAPRVTSITRQTPSSSPTNADSLTWRVTFNETVQNVNAADFQVSGTTATLAAAQVGATNAYDVTASGGNLAGLASTTVTLSFANGQDIEDSSGNALGNTTPTGTNHNTFVVNNTPTLSLSLASSSGAEGNSGSRDVNVGIVLTATGSRGIEYLFCVKNTGTARFRTAQGNRAKDFDVFTSNGNSPLGLTRAGTCQAFQSASNGQLAKLRIFGDTTAEGNETAVLELRRHPRTPADVVISPTAGTATYTITNDDGTPPVITISGGPAVTEDTDASFTVNASPAPAANLDVTVAVTQSGDFVASSNRGAKTVTIAANATSKTYTVPTVNDMVDEANGSVTVTVNSGEGYTVGSTAAATVTVNDNDTAAVTINESDGVSVSEAAGTGRTDTYTVALATQPTHGVTITPTSSNTAAATVSGTLTFTTSNWNTPQTVTVTGVDDNVDNPGGGRDVSISHTASSTDPNYAIGSAGNVEVRVTDDDDTSTNVIAVTVLNNDMEVSISAGETVNEGENATFTLAVTPAPAPGNPVTVNLMLSASGEVISSGETGSRSITIHDGGAARITVSTEDDAVWEEDGIITASVIRGTGYRPHSRRGSASIRVRDNDDIPGLLLSPERLTVEQGGSNVYTVALDDQPGTEVTVSISIREPEGMELLLDPTVLTFSPRDWDRPQPVRVTAPETAELVGRDITLLHRVSVGAHEGSTAYLVVEVVADPLELKAWHLRFGRTVSQQVVGALQDRFAAPPTTGLELTVAGEDFTSDTPLAENQGLLSKALGFENLTGEELLEGSSFSFAPQGEGSAPQLAFWGQGAFSSFSGQEEEVSLDGDVTTLLVGGDWSTGRWQAGAALSRSWGNVSYDGDDNAEGEISTSLTGLFPYGRYALSPRLGLWATAGYGWGDLSLNPDGMEEEYKPDITLAMVALGMDGLLLDGGSEGVSLTTTADLLSLKTTSDEVKGLASSEGNLSRFRLGLEATRPFPLANGASLLPTLEMGIRQDSGDAETGFGMDLGAGITWKDPQRGISGELKGRTLLSHAEEDFQDQGLALSFSWDPSPSNRGPSLSVSHAMGATATADMDALFHPATFEQMDGNASSGQQFEAELAYGFPLHNDRLTLTPAVAMALSPTSRNYGLLWSLAPYTEQLQADPWQFSIEAERQEHNSPSTPTDHSLKLRFSTLL